MAARTVSRLGLVGGLALVIAGFAWLMFVVGGQHGGQLPLIDVPGAKIDVIVDAAKELTQAQVAALPETAWRPWTERGYLRAQHGPVIWARVRLANPEAEPWRGVLSDTSYFSDRVELWQVTSAGEWRSEVSGDAVPSTIKPIWARTAAFAVTIPAKGEQLFYLRASDAYLAHLQLTWWTRMEDFFATLVKSVLTECICYGALLALVIYNLVLWVRLRFADTGYYVLSAIGSLTGNVVANGGPALLGLTLGSPGHEALISGAFAWSSVWMVQFTRVFLGTAERLPRLDRWLRNWMFTLVAVGLGVLAMPWMSTPFWLTVVACVAVLTDIVCLATALVAWRAGAGHARFFVLAFTFVFIAAVPALISLLRGDVIRGAALGLMAGRTLEMLLLSFAVADRFDQTQRALIEETEQRRAIEEAYADELETEVRERTRELRQANMDKDRMLTVVGHDLRGPLTGLMRAADHSSNALSTEVSRTGRALLLLIEDLVLWARLRAGTQHMAPHPLNDLAAPAVSLHHGLADHAGIKLVVDLPSDLRVQTDLVLAQTLVRNLLANALKFAETRVELYARHEWSGAVRFTVSNDGPPLPPEVAARFAAGKDEPITATGGLGLRLCREICSALGTRLEAAESPGGGTEFSFMLVVIKTAEGVRQ